MYHDGVQQLAADPFPHPQEMPNVIVIHYAPELHFDRDDPNFSPSRYNPHNSAIFGVNYLNINDIVVQCGALQAQPVSENRIAHPRERVPEIGRVW